MADPIATATNAMVMAFQCGLSRSVMGRTFAFIFSIQSGVNSRVRRSARGIGKSDNFEIERFLQFKAEIQYLKSNPALLPERFEISDFGFKLQESFNFEIVRFPDFPCFVTD
jgi:hypothetical protein